MTNVVHKDSKLFKGLLSPLIPDLSVHPSSQVEGLGTATSNKLLRNNIGGGSFNLNQLSQFSPQQLQIIASFIQMLQAGTTQPNNTLTPNARVAKFVCGMWTFTQEGRLMERQIEDP